jgi:hypothetical protein
MRYYLNLFSPKTWSAFRASGGTVAGFSKAIKKRAAQVVAGDTLVCYLAGVSRWCGALEVREGPYFDATPLFIPIKDKFVIRFRVRPIVVLQPEHAIPIGQLWNQLNRTRGLDRTSRGWAFSARLLSSLNSVGPADGKLIVDCLLSQAVEPQTYPFEPVHERLIRACEPRP